MPFRFGLKTEKNEQHAGINAPPLNEKATGVADGAQILLIILFVKEVKII